MGAQTGIEWTDATWNPVRAVTAAGKRGWHCEHVSAGCKFCYAEALNRRLGTGLDYKPGLRDQVTHELQDNLLLAPLRWRKPRRIFLSSMTDVFAPWVTDAMLDRMFAVMALCPQHIFQVLTKRPERARAYLTTGFFARSDAVESLPKAAAHFGWPRAIAQAALQSMSPLPNVWIGTSVEDQAAADERIPHLLATPAAKRFLSCEPLLGRVDLRMLHYDGVTNINALTGDHGVIQPMRGRGPALDWVIAGGESGRDARDWHGLDDAMRSLRDQCRSAGVAFFAKQMAGVRKPLRPIPNDLNIQEMPL